MHDVKFLCLVQEPNSIKLFIVNVIPNRVYHADMYCTKNTQSPIYLPLQNSKQLPALDGILKVEIGECWMGAFVHQGPIGCMVLRWVQ